jgi:hypothetical protein
MNGGEIFGHWVQFYGKVIILKKGWKFVIGWFIELLSKIVYIAIVVTSINAKIVQKGKMRRNNTGISQRGNGSQDRRRCQSYDIGVRLDLWQKCS